MHILHLINLEDVCFHAGVGDFQYLQRCTVHLSICLFTGRYYFCVATIWLHFVHCIFFVQIKRSSSLNCPVFWILHFLSHCLIIYTYHVLTYKNPFQANFMKIFPRLFLFCLPCMKRFDLCTLILFVSLYYWRYFALSIFI